MSNTIQIKRSSTANSVPTAGQLAQGELAVNLVDKKLYTKDNTNAVVELSFSINGLTTTAVATNDFLPFADTSNSGVNRKATVADILALGISTNNILSATAGASVGAVGTYAQLRTANITGPLAIANPGSLFAGSALLYSTGGGSVSSISPSGTWMLVGYLESLPSGSTGGSQRSSMWLRIS
jgi:hypothetical protein